MADFGRDLACETDITAMLAENSGNALMRGVVCRRLNTPNQSLLSAPNEQTTDVRQYLNTEQPRDESLITKMRADATAALLADQRIDEVTVSIEWDPDAHYIRMPITGKGGQGPFSLTLGISRAKVEVLQ